MLLLWVLYISVVSVYFRVTNTHLWNMMSCFMFEFHQGFLLTNILCKNIQKVIRFFALAISHSLSLLRKWRGDIFLPFVLCLFFAHCMITWCTCRCSMFKLARQAPPDMSMKSDEMFLKKGHQTLFLRGKYKQT